MNSRQNEHKSKIKVWPVQVVQYRVRLLNSEYVGAYFSEQKLFIFKIKINFMKGPVQ